MLKNKSYFKKTNKFSKNTRMFEEDYTTIEVTKYMNSINEADRNFTNFVKSQGADKYITMCKIYKCLKTESDALNKYFIAEEIFKNYSMLNLKVLIEKNTKMRLTDNEIIMNVRKFNFKEDSGIRLFFLRKDDELILVLADIYHLIFPSKGRDSQAEYKRKKDFKFNLNNICKYS